MTDTNEPVLCYVSGYWAYFTTQSLEKQWGDDWNDAPYEHNAEEPYEWSERDKEPEWKIVKVAFQCRLESPNEWASNSNYSVEDINRRQMVPWLQTGRGEARAPDTSIIRIWAGTPLSEFIRLIKLAGGVVYVESPPEVEE